MIESGNSVPPSDALPVLGNKAFNLLTLAALGLPVPPGFVLPTSIYATWIAGELPSLGEFHAFVSAPLDRLQHATKLGFGDPKRPLLVAVRSSAAVSMPGMLDTVLNIGLTRATLPGVMALTGNPRLAWDCYMRLIVSYAEIVYRLDTSPFDEARTRVMTAADATTREELDTLSLRALTLQCLDIFEELAGKAFPDDPVDQLLHAVDAVFRSWNAERAKSYRRINDLKDIPGTAVTVQRMVHGNAGPRSGAGVGFTRDPATGERRLYLDFALDAQGEDVVSGRRRLTPVVQLPHALLEANQLLEQLAVQLEQVFCDAQDFEFVVQEGELFLLQTRQAKRSPWSRLRIAVDLAREGLITRDEALRRIEGLDVLSLTRRRVASGPHQPIARGVPASIGVATGSVALSIHNAQTQHAKDGDVILVRDNIATEDIEGIMCASGILTARGGRTSHAAVVARELGKVAVVACGDLEVSGDGKSCLIGGRRFRNGDSITLDGETGYVYAGDVEVTETRPVDELAILESWRHDLHNATP